MLRLRNAPSRLTDFPANQYAAVTEPCGVVFDHNNRYYDGTLGYTTWVAAFVNIEWAPFLPHDLTNSPTTVTSAQISAVAGTHSGYNTPKRKDNPTTNATFLDGHVATWSYQQLVAWAAAYRSGSGGCYPPFFGDTSGG
jgi:prepilin-type processing-associated H-X9-DG protein